MLPLLGRALWQLVEVYSYMAIEISIYPCQRLILAYTTYKFHNNRTIRSQWNHYRLILGKVYQLDSGVELLDIPGGRVVRALDFG